MEKQSIMIFGVVSIPSTKQRLLIDGDGEKANITSQGVSEMEDKIPEDQREGLAEWILDHLKGCEEEEDVFSELRTNYRKVCLNENKNPSDKDLFNLFIDLSRLNLTTKQMAALDQKVYHKLIKAHDLIRKDSGYSADQYLEMSMELIDLLTNDMNNNVLKQFTYDRLIKASVEHLRYLTLNPKPFAELQSVPWFDFDVFETLELELCKELMKWPNSAVKLLQVISVQELNAINASSSLRRSMIIQYGDRFAEIVKKGVTIKQILELNDIRFFKICYESNDDKDIKMLGPKPLTSQQDGTKEIPFNIMNQIGMFFEYGSVFVKYIEAGVLFKELLLLDTSIRARLSQSKMMHQVFSMMKLGIPFTEIVKDLIYLDDTCPIKYYSTTVEKLIKLRIPYCQIVQSDEDDLANVEERILEISYLINEGIPPDWMISLVRIKRTDKLVWDIKDHGIEGAKEMVLKEEAFQEELRKTSSPVMMPVAQLPTNTIEWDLSNPSLTEARRFYAQALKDDAEEVVCGKYLREAGVTLTQMLSAPYQRFMQILWYPGNIVAFLRAGVKIEEIIALNAVQFIQIILHGDTQSCELPYVKLVEAGCPFDDLLKIDEVKRKLLERSWNNILPLLKEGLSIDQAIDQYTQHEKDFLAKSLIGKRSKSSTENPNDINENSVKEHDQLNKKG